MDGNSRCDVNSFSILMQCQLIADTVSVIKRYAGKGFKVTERLMDSVSKIRTRSGARVSWVTSQFCDNEFWRHRNRLAMTAQNHVSIRCVLCVLLCVGMRTSSYSFGCCCASCRLGERAGGMCDFFQNMTNYLMQMPVDEK